MGLVFNPAVYPPDGHYFKQGDVKIKAASASKLVQAVRDYRIAHHIPVGNPIQEINDFTCARYPVGCSDVPDSYPMPDPVKHAKMPGSVAFGTQKWLTDLYRALINVPSQEARVSNEEAGRRAAICASCPYQAFWGTGCGGCDAGSKRLAFSIRQGRDAPGGEKLQACGLLREDTRTSVFIKGLKPSDKTSLPANCWRKTA